MPQLTVKIVYDRPVDDPNWLNEDNVSTALQAYCKNTRFDVTTVVPWALCPGEVSLPNTDEAVNLPEVKYARYLNDGYGPPL